MGERHAAYRLPHRLASGDWQMAADAALLGWVSRGPACLVFRTYSWDRPTLSLGRSEPFPGGWDEAALAREGIAVVRRPTGGDAVFHWEELTFAVAASLPGPWATTPRRFANEVADALVEALRHCGVPAARVDFAEPRSAPARPGAAPCFARTAPGEVRAAGFKVAGLASRFARAGALCHASVPLTARHREVARFRRSGRGEAGALMRHARSAGELLGRVPDPTTLAGSLADAIAVRFGATLEAATFSALGIEELASFPVEAATR